MPGTRADPGAHAEMPCAMPEIPPANAPSPGTWRTALPLLLALKAVALLIDGRLRLFLPDSALYFQAAIDGIPPADRSFLYSGVISATGLAGGSALWLLLAQAAFGVATALLLHAWLRRAGVRPWLALAAAASLALDPAQLFYERMMMAESAGLLLLAGCFVAASAYVERGQSAWIPLYALLGVGAVGFRLSLLPVVIGLCLLAPLLRAAWQRPAGAAARWRAAAHVALAVAATALAHQGYRSAYGAITHGPPGYTASAGRFRLGVLAPLVEPRHFQGSGVDPRVLEQVQLDRHDPRLREAQIWLPGGLVDVVSRHAAAPEVAAAVIAGNALRDRPLVLARVAGTMLRDHLDPDLVQRQLENDLGNRGPNQRVAGELRARLGLETRDLHLTDSPARRWFALGSVWLTGCLVLLAPLALALPWLARRLPAPGSRSLLALASLGLVAGHLMFSPLPSLRYLHPLPWFTLAAIALLAEVAWRRREARTAPVPQEPERGGERKTQ
jgi:hypothetical protein